MGDPGYEWGVRRVLAVVGLAMAVTVAVGCAPPIRVNTMASPTANFAGRSTWAWRPAAGGEVGNSVVGQVIEQDIAQQLAAKGYQQVEGGSPAFFMDYRVILRQEASLEGFGGGWGGGTLQTVHFTRGMLVVSASDPATDQAIWQGSASTVIDPDGGGSQATEQIGDSVTKLFQTFPARS